MRALTGLRSPDVPYPEDALPVDRAAFAARLDPLLPQAAGPIAVAVSGGPDSLALLHLADRWARSNGCELIVYTVDHRLRAASAGEAAEVARVSASLGRSHRTLPWRGSKPARGLQAAARDARYRLLLDACRRDGAGVLLLAHHRDDQAETVLHRIDRDTGPEGLAGMAPSRAVDGVSLLRPLLDLPKARLVATCRAAGLSWAEDPSNSDPRFARSRLRELAPVLAEAGVTAERLARLATAMTVARTAFDGFVAIWLDAHAEIGPGGSMTVDRLALNAAPALLRDRLVERILRAVGGSGYPPRSERLARLVAWVGEDPVSPRARTLAGCRIELDRRTVAVVRDWRQAGEPVTVAAGGRARWDGRFEVENPTDRPVRVGVCGTEGWRRWRRTAPGRAVAAGSSIPHAARLALPAVVDLDGGIALPHLVPSAPAPFGWVGEAVRVRFRPTGLSFVTDPLVGGGSSLRPSLPCNGRQAT